MESMKITQSFDDISTWFFSTLENLLQNQKTVIVGLAGGTSYDHWYRHLLENKKSKLEIYASRIHWCVTDERVNCSLKERNDEHIWEVFLGPLFQKYSLPEENFVRPAMESDGIEYSLRLGNMDIAFFWIGLDGHTASLFPHHIALQSEEIGFISIKNAPKDPPERISLSPKSLQNLKQVCLFALWDQKKEALTNFLNDSVDVIDCPAKFLKPEIILDLTD